LPNLRNAFDILVTYKFKTLGEPSKVRLSESRLLRGYCHEFETRNLILIVFTLDKFLCMNRYVHPVIYRVVRESKDELIKQLLYLANSGTTYTYHQFK